jgi:hypothetical protein
VYSEAKQMHTAIGLKPDTQYEFRLMVRRMHSLVDLIEHVRAQAWNALGHSDPITIMSRTKSCPRPSPPWSLVGVAIFVVFILVVLRWQFTRCALGNYGRGLVTCRG